MFTPFMIADLIKCKSLSASVSAKWKSVKLGPILEAKYLEENDGSDVRSAQFLKKYDLARAKLTM